MGKNDKGKDIYVDQRGGVHTTREEAFEADSGYDDRVRESPADKAEKEDKDPK